MTEYWLGSSRYTAILNSTTRYLPVSGPGNLGPTEANQQARVRFAGTFRNLYFRVRTNTLNGASTVRSRINGANGNQSVSVPASTTGDFEDVVNSDALLTADLINSQLVCGGSMNDMRNMVMGYTLNNTDNNRGIIIAGVNADDVGAPFAGDTLHYTPIGGGIEGDSRPESREEYTFRHDSTFSQLRVFVDTNEPTGASTVRLRINGADGNLNLSIPGSTTGEFEDTVNSDAIAVGDNVNHRVITGPGGHGGPEVIITMIQMHHSAGETRLYIGGGTDPIHTGSSILFLAPESNDEWDSFVDSLQYCPPARFPYDVRNYFLNLGENAYDVPSVFTVREGIADVDTALTVTVPTSTTGKFEDTVNTFSVAVGEKIYSEWDATGWTSGTASLNIVGMEVSLQVAPLDNYAPMVVRRVEVLAY